MIQVRLLYSFATGIMNAQTPFSRRHATLVLWAFLLNGAWELLQCIFLYDMWDWPFWKATLWMWAAIFGDIVIVLALYAAAARLTGSERPTFWIVLLSIGLAAAVLLEWLARVLDLWSYSAAMPSIGVLGQEVGIAPLVQITVLPALSVYMANRTVSDE